MKMGKTRSRGLITARVADVSAVVVMGAAVYSFRPVIGPGAVNLPTYVISA